MLVLARLLPLLYSCPPLRHNTYVQNMWRLWDRTALLVPPPVPQPALLPVLLAAPLPGLPPQMVGVQRSACMILRNMSTHTSAELRPLILDAGAEELIRAARAAHRRDCDDVGFGALRDLGCAMGMSGEGKKD